MESFFKELTDVIRSISITGEANRCEVVLHALRGSEKVVWIPTAHRHGSPVHLWEDTWQANPGIVRSRLLSLVGRAKRIHGRATTVKRVNKATADRFLKAHHLQGTTSAYYKFGLYRKDELVAVATFGKSRIMTDGVVPYRSYEWERFATLSGYTVTGGLQKLLKAFIAEVHPAHIMTYIDSDWSSGSGYEKLGFKKVGHTGPITYLVKPGEWIRHPLNKAPADAEKQGYSPVTNSGSVKMVLDLRDQTS